jgi:transcriptional regulator
MRKHTKLSDADVRAMRQQRKDGGLLREIARNFECSTSNVSLIVRGLSR